MKLFYVTEAGMIFFNYLEKKINQYGLIKFNFLQKKCLINFLNFEYLTQNIDLKKLFWYQAISECIQNFFYKDKK